MIVKVCLEKHILTPIFVLIKLSNRAIRGISILDIYTFNDKDNFGLF